MGVLTKPQQRAYDRKMKIMKSLHELDYLSTTQLLKLHDLKTTRNALRIIGDMSDYLNGTKLGEMVFTLSDEGRRIVGSEKELDSRMKIQTVVMRNEVYIEFLPSVWEPEKEITWANGKKSVTCEAYMETKTMPFFVELDANRIMNANYRQINRYAELKDSGVWKTEDGKFPCLLFLTISDYRMKKIKEACESAGLEHRVMLLDDLS